MAARPTSRRSMVWGINGQEAKRNEAARSFSKTAILLCDNRTHPLHDRGRCRFIFHNRASRGVGCRRSADFVRLCVAPFALTQILGKKLALFTSDLCGTLDNMIAGNKGISLSEDSETQLARIGHRLARLYQIMQEDRRRVEEDRQELQSLVSDISHQVKTPVSNLKMATDTLLEKPMTEAERTDFIRGIRTQTDKLDFLFSGTCENFAFGNRRNPVGQKVSAAYMTPWRRP